MNEPKRRGRPSKAEQELKAALVESMRLDPPDLMKLPAVEQAPNSVPHINGDESREPEDVLLPTMDIHPDLVQAIAERAQAYAMRIWNNQSVDVGRGIRVARCIAALQGQGLPTDGIVYPESV